MTVAALIMGRAGSVGVPGKNVRIVNGRPLCTYPMIAAREAKLVDVAYVSTDCSTIKGLATVNGVRIINRPTDLSGADSEMSDVIMHAYDAISTRLGHAPDIMVTMHANCGTHREGLIDECVQALLDDPSLDSCVSARVVQDLHPYRLKRVTADGLLATWLDVPEDTSNNRQQIQDVAVVLDGACRAFRPDRCLPPTGQPPFRYLGHRIGWRDNPGGLDVHSKTDFDLTEAWLNEHPWRSYGAGCA